MKDVLSRSLYERHLNATVALVDVRKLARDLGRRTVTPLLDAIQAFVREDVECRGCRGECSVEHGDEWRICLDCDGKGHDLSVRVPRLFDRYRDEGSKVLCSACLQPTHEDDVACEHCDQRFVLAPALEDVLLASLDTIQTPAHACSDFSPRSAA